MENELKTIKCEITNQTDTHTCGCARACVSRINIGKWKTTARCTGAHLPNCSRLFCTGSSAALMTLKRFPSKRRVMSRRRLWKTSSSKYSNCEKSEILIIIVLLNIRPLGKGKTSCWNIDSYIIIAQVQFYQIRQRVENGCVHIV